MSYLRPHKRWIARRDADPDAALRSPVREAVMTVDWVVSGNAEAVAFVTDAHIDSQMRALNTAFRADVDAALLAAKVDPAFRDIAGVDTRIRFEKGEVRRVESARTYRTVQRFVRNFRRRLGVEFRREALTIIVTDIGSEFAFLAQTVLPHLAERSTGALAMVTDFRAVGNYDDPALAALGVEPPLPTYRSGRTIVHEMGHAFGVQHTFFEGCTTLPDQQYHSDVPRIAAPWQVLAKEVPPGQPVSSCVPGTPVMVSNFMEYTAGDARMASFTVEQVAFMHYMLTEEPSLLGEAVRVERYADGVTRPFATLLAPAKPIPRRAAPRACAWRECARQSDLPSADLADEEIFINDLLLEEILTDLAEILAESIYLKIQAFYVAGTVAGPVPASFVADEIFDDYYATLSSTSSVVDEESADAGFACLVDELTFLINENFDVINDFAPMDVFNAVALTICFCTERILGTDQDCLDAVFDTIEDAEAAGFARLPVDLLRTQLADRRAREAEKGPPRTQNGKDWEKKETWPDVRR